MSFVTDHFELCVGIVVILVFCILAGRALAKARKIDRDGIETDAVVSRIAEAFDTDNLSSSYTTYVQYVDRDGNTVESFMTLDDTAEYQTGDRVRIKYIPGDTKMVRPVK